MIRIDPNPDNRCPKCYAILVHREDLVTLEPYGEPVVCPECGYATDDPPRPYHVDDQELADAGFSS
jgi:hypothetical protein